MKKKSSTWKTVFWIVTILCILQFLFIRLPQIRETPNVTGTYILGSLIPNGLIILIFWFIKRKSEK
ncbi:preprotein translocase subunit YajC [Chryseobacterium ginsenosidimutans]|uniref:Preprotein translocase subunit YajC n=1 Tax=Chryseobacterium geocarposphaerae TaxID=1416776 RepID=A0ABU1LHA8_9FLAO|nr:preprotein translocase subunit YajC [Chryseobacterium geocarposphaerae]MDR6699419.1 preprotein translocase subunit YajC [Chryseobacterium ginsenosidimutans]